MLKISFNTFHGNGLFPYFLKYIRKLGLYSFFEGHNPPLFFLHHFLVPSPLFLKYFQPPIKDYPPPSPPPSVTATLQTNFFSGIFFFSFNLKVKGKQPILDILVLTCVNFNTLFLLNKLLMK